MLDTGILGATLQDLQWFPGSHLWCELWTLKYNLTRIPELSSRVIQLYGWLHFRNRKGLSPVKSRSDTRKYYLPAISVLQFNILRTPTEILLPSLCNCPSRQLAVCEQTVLILRMLWSQSFDGTWHPHCSLLFHRPVCRHGFMDSLLCPGSTAKSSYTETLFDFSGQTHKHYNTRY